jgi:DNA-binding NarL/FixJ family response regulator
MTATLLRELVQESFDVVGQVGDGVALVEEADRLSPDVIVTDVGMPGLDGLEAARRILASHPSSRIVLITVHSNRALVEKALAAGVLGYVVKRVMGDALVPAIHAALRGDRRVTGVAGFDDDGTPTVRRG